MILKGSQRSHASELARHLMNARDNEHVELYELRGFISDELEPAFKEAQAISCGTRCRQYLISLSLNPPGTKQVSVAEFEAAIDQIEQRLGLNGQPRAIVFHEKEGRRHAHAVWSRIDIDEMKAVQLPFFKMKLMDVSKELYLEHDWQMPNGMIDHHARNPLNLSLAEWQQAKRIHQDPRKVKAVFRQCWMQSDSKRALQAALEEKGYYPARGDRRGFVAVDYRGEVYALARWSGVKTKDVKVRLGDPSELPSVEEVKGKIAAKVSDKLRGYVQDVEKNYSRLRPSIELQRQELLAQHREERKTLKDQQEKRLIRETNKRAARLPKGLGGLWSRITGDYTKIRDQNERDAWQALQRDRSEKDDLILRQLDERRSLQNTITQVRDRKAQELQALNNEISTYLRSRMDPDRSLKEEFTERTELQSNRRSRKRDLSKARSQDFGLER